MHRFCTGFDQRSPAFVTRFDLDEGDDGVLEDEVRVDQLVGTAGDRVWYEYDFGDGWDHVLTVEKVLDEPAHARPMHVRSDRVSTRGLRRLGWLRQLAAWVRARHDESRLPTGFAVAATARSVIRHQ